MSKIIQFAAYVDGASMKKDKTMSIKLGTQELSAPEMGEIMGMANMLIYATLSEVAVAKDDIVIPEALTEFKTDKTPSQRLRARMFVYFKEKHKTEEGFQEWYARVLDGIGQRYLDQVE